MVSTFVALCDCAVAWGDQAVHKSGTLISGLLIIIIRGEWSGEGRERVAFMFLWDGGEGTFF
jgi:hypothetical protein